MKISNFGKVNILFGDNTARILSFAILFGMFFSAISIQVINVAQSQNILAEVERGVNLFCLSIGFVFSLWFFGIAIKKLIVKYLTVKRFLKVSDLGLVAGISGYLMLFTGIYGYQILQSSTKSEVDAVSIFIGFSCVLMAFLIRMRDKKSSVYDDVLLRRVNISFFNEKAVYANFVESGYRKIVSHIGTGFLTVALSIILGHIFLF